MTQRTLRAFSLVQATRGATRAALIALIAGGIGACGEDGPHSHQHLDGGLKEDGSAPADGAIPDDGSLNHSDGSVLDGMDGSAPDGQTDAGDTTLTYTVGGQVAGLATGATLVLQNNEGDDLAVVSNGAFAFAEALGDGATYSVSVLQQPQNPSQTCTVSQASGFVAASDVSSVMVTCTTNAFSVSGVVTGLSGMVTLKNNGGDDLIVDADGSFTFATAIASGASYEVTVATQPTAGSCSVSGGTGVVGGADVNSITVNCAANRYTVGGSVAGLKGGTVVLSNGGEERAVSSNGTFAFANTYSNGTAYSVAVVSQPVDQTCSAAQASGVVAASNVTDVEVTCVTNEYEVGGTLTGLPSGTTVVLQNNSGDDLSLMLDGQFKFAGKVAAGASYSVSVRTQPAGAVCTVSGATGTVVSADVTSVVVNCAANAFTVGGTISGLTSSVVLQNNAGSDLTLTANGSYAFPETLAAGATYSVTVKRQPQGQTCSVANGAGTVTTANVDNVNVTCVTNTYSVGGTVSGLDGTVVLRNNGRDMVTRNADGAFTFNELIATGGTYDVTVAQQPAGQHCSVSQGAGTVTDANVSNVAVTCVSDKYSIGGFATGVVGASVVLQNNGADDHTVSSNGPFTFNTPLATGATYNVTVLSAPAGRTCQVTNGSGTVGTTPVVNVIVSCTLSF